MHWVVETTNKPAFMLNVFVIVKCVHPQSGIDGEHPAMGWYDLKQGWTVVLPGTQINKADVRYWMVPPPAPAPAEVPAAYVAKPEKPAPGSILGDLETSGFGLIV